MDYEMILRKEGLHNNFVLFHPDRNENSNIQMFVCLLDEIRFWNQS